MEDEDRYAREVGVYTARAVTVRRVCGWAGGLRCRSRRGGSGGVPALRGPGARVDRGVDEDWRSWGRCRDVVFAEEGEGEVSRFGVRVRVLTVDRRNGPSAKGKINDAVVDGVAAKRGDEEEGEEVFIGIARDLLPTGHDTMTTTTASLDWGYTDDNRSLFLPTMSSTQSRACANAIFLPALPKENLIVGDNGCDGRPKARDLSYASSASSLSLVPTVFDVRAPTPPPARTTAVVADDKDRILPSEARRHVGILGDSEASSLRRGGGRSRSSVRLAPSSGGLESAAAVPARGSLVPAAVTVLPDERVQRSSLVSGDRVGGYDEWSSASEMGVRYGKYPGVLAPGEDWRSRWMRYEGDYR